MSPSATCPYRPHVVTHRSVHPRPVIGIAKFTEHLQLAVCMDQGKGRMSDAIKHVGLDRGVVDHVLKDDILADLQLVVKLPAAHEIAA